MTDFSPLTPDELKELPTGLRASYQRADEALAQITHTTGHDSKETGLATQLAMAMTMRCRAHLVQERTRVVEAARDVA